MSNHIITTYILLLTYEVHILHDLACIIPSILFCMQYRYIEEIYILPLNVSVFTALTRIQYLFSFFFEWKIFIPSIPKIMSGHVLSFHKRIYFCYQDINHYDCLRQSCLALFQQVTTTILNPTVFIFSTTSQMAFTCFIHTNRILQCVLLMCKDLFTQHKAGIPRTDQCNVSKVMLHVVLFYKYDNVFIGSPLYEHLGSECLCIYAFSQVALFLTTIWEFGLLSICINIWSQGSL